MASSAWLSHWVCYARYPHRYHRQRGNDPKGKHRYRLRNPREPGWRTVLSAEELEAGQFLMPPDVQMRQLENRRHLFTIFPEDS